MSDTLIPVDDERAEALKAAVSAGDAPSLREAVASAVDAWLAERALNDVYSESGVGADQLSTARELARKKLPSLQRLDPVAAKRRLVGMLQRRGFDYETIKPVIEEVLGRGADGPHAD